MAGGLDSGVGEGARAKWRGFIWIQSWCDARHATGGAGAHARTNEIMACGTLGRHFGCNLVPLSFGCVACAHAEMNFLFCFGSVEAVSPTSRPLSSVSVSHTGHSDAARSAVLGLRWRCWLGRAALIE